MADRRLRRWVVSLLVLAAANGMWAFYLVRNWSPRDSAPRVADLPWPVVGSTRNARYGDRPAENLEPMRDGPRFGAHGPSRRQLVSVVDDCEGPFRYVSLSHQQMRLQRAVDELRERLRSGSVSLPQQLVVDYYPQGGRFGQPLDGPDTRYRAARVRYAVASRAALDRLVASAHGLLTSGVIDASGRLVYAAPLFPHQDYLPADGNVLLGAEGRLLIFASPWHIDVFWRGREVPMNGHTSQVPGYLGLHGVHVELRRDPGSPELHLVMASPAGEVIARWCYAIVGDRLVEREGIRASWVAAQYRHDDEQQVTWAARAAVGLFVLHGLAFGLIGTWRPSGGGTLRIGVVDVATSLAMTACLAYLAGRYALFD